MLLEDVGSVDLWMQFPNSVEAMRIAGLPIAGDVVGVGSGEGDDLGVGEHLDEFKARSANEALSDLGFVLTHGLADEEDWFHCDNLRISSSRYHCAFFKFSTGSPLSMYRQRYLIAFPTLKFMCRVTSMHSMPEGCLR